MIMSPPFLLSFFLSCLVLGGGKGGRKKNLENSKRQLQKPPHVVSRVSALPGPRLIYVCSVLAFSLSLKFLPSSNPQPHWD